MLLMILGNHCGHAAAVTATTTVITIILVRMAVSLTDKLLLHTVFPAKGSILLAEEPPPGGTVDEIIMMRQML